jgi:hypothetical protein
MAADRRMLQVCGCCRGFSGCKPFKPETWQSRFCKPSSEPCLEVRGTKYHEPPASGGRQCLNLEPACRAALVSAYWCLCASTEQRCSAVVDASLWEESGCCQIPWPLPESVKLVPVLNLCHTAAEPRCMMLCGDLTELCYATFCQIPVVERQDAGSCPCRGGSLSRCAERCTGW